MDPNQQKEQFSKAYVRAVAAVGGYTVHEPEVDDDSINLGLAATGGHGLYRSPRLELQLKCTAQSVLDEECLRFPLKIKNYNDLRLQNFLVPRILIVVTVPDRIEDWVLQSEQELAMRHCGYWISIRGMDESANSETVTIAIPRGQQFTVECLTSMMQRIRDGGLP